MKILLIAAACLSLSSCAGVIKGTFRGPISGAVYDENGVHVDQSTISNLVGKFTRLLTGEDPGSVILDPFSK